MLRQVFDRELQHIMDQVAHLGSMVEEALTHSVEVLKRRDLVASQAVIDGDDAINALRFELEEAILILIATQQPMASDLRMVAALLEVLFELERIGDYAKGIGKISLLIGTEPLVKPLVDLPRMAAMGRDMLHRAVDALMRQDIEQARAIPLEDDEVDALYNQVFRELLTLIMAKPSILEQANYLLWVAHNLERAADRVVNICERTVFTVTGKMKEMDVEPL